MVFCLPRLVYTLRVPFSSKPTIILSIVHHIRAEGKNFVSTGGNKEHIFGFIAGFERKHLGQLLTDRVTRWQDIPQDHLKTSTGMTPRLFVAALLSQYGSIVYEDIIRAGRNLETYDSELNKVFPILTNMTQESSDDNTNDRIHRLSLNLIGMNLKLTGSRSTAHYLAESANVLVKDISTLEKYIEARLEEWTENPDRGDLKEALRQLDSFKETIRDNDKLVMVRKSMFQYKENIKSLQQHIDINVGTVSQPSYLLHTIIFQSMIHRCEI
jgi:hypothetical protein